MFYELNMDGLVGPTHHYAGLSSGNVACITNARSIANPKAAALQGLSKMKALHDAGILQAFLPPHRRPHLPLLKQLGFEGNIPVILEKAYQHAPALLSAAYSSSNMWTANAATVTSSVDSDDGLTHFTAANLNANIHRHIEAEFSQTLLKIAFNDAARFKHHPVLPSTAVTGDEGAANHTRLCSQHGQAGINLFVFGQQALHNQTFHRPKRYLARQTLEASRQIVRNHGLLDNQTIFACQNPEVIDLGVFHNDVISVGNESLLLIHEQAYVNQSEVLHQLHNLAKFDLKICQIKASELSVTDVVNSYLFNSQVITRPNQAGMLLVAPSECEHTPRVFNVIQRWLDDSHCPINEVLFFDLKQSMRNGGGPACLRLRVPLSAQDYDAMHAGFKLDEQRFSQLESWIKTYYRDRLQLEDLRDPQLIEEVQVALDKLARLMNLPEIYQTNSPC